jgi:hypothetical protein
LNGEQVGWIDPGEVPGLADARTTVPAQPGWWLVTAGDGEVRRYPVVAWRVDDRATTGRVKPVTASWEVNEAVELGGFLYALLPPEGDALDGEGVPLGARDDLVLLTHLEELRSDRENGAAADACREGEG